MNRFVCVTFCNNKKLDRTLIVMICNNYVEYRYIGSMTNISTTLAFLEKRNFYTYLIHHLLY